jgi:hypothetical protein
LGQGAELHCKKLKEFCRAESIKFEYTMEGSIKMNKRLVEKARAMLVDAKLDRKFWAEAVSTANYLQNILPESEVEKSPHELFYGFAPDLKDLKVFGSEAFVQIPHQKDKKKFRVKSERLFFVGYSPDHKEFRFLNPGTSEITMSRDAVFIQGKEESVAVKSSVMTRETRGAV